MRIARLSLIFICVIGGSYFLTSCFPHLLTVRQYEGPSKKNDQIARVVVPVPALVKSVDGKQVEAKSRRYTVLELLPGNHVLDVMYHKVEVEYNLTTTIATRPVPISFTAEANKLYFILTEEKDYSSRHYITDAFPMTMNFSERGVEVSLVRARLEPAEGMSDEYFWSVADKGETKLYDALNTPDTLPVYSENKEHIAFILETMGDSKRYPSNHRWFVDGIPEAHVFTSIIGRLKFNSDGSRYVYLGMREKETYIVLDGKAKPFPYIDPAASEFSFNGKNSQLAYSAVPKEGEAYVFEAENKHGPFQNVVAVAYRGDSQRLVYFAKRDGKWRLYIDHEEKQPGFVDLGPTNVLFSPDENRWAYLAMAGGKYAVVTDSGAGDFFDLVSLPVYSVDSVHFAYAAKNKEGKSLVFVDGESAGEFENADFDSIAFNEESTCVFCKIKKGESWVITELSTVDKETISGNEPRSEN